MLYVNRERAAGYGSGMIAVRLVCISAFCINTAPAQKIDSTTHSVRLVPVENTVSIEVLDWGGSGHPLVLLAGLGDTAHVFDAFAPKLTVAYHVYGITRRGFGASSAPAPSDTGAYSADRLGDDVLAVIAHLGLHRPVVAGHSIAGEELSSIGCRHPDLVGGLVYLDAAYGYAFYDRSGGDLYLDLLELKTKLALLQPGKGPNDTRPVIRELLENLLPRFQLDLHNEKEFLDAVPPRMLTGSSASMPPVSQAVIAGEQKYRDIKAPVLAIFAVPHDMGFGENVSAQAAFDLVDLAGTGRQADAFEKGVASARVIRLPHANHYVFRSNESEVIGAIEKFVDTLR